MTELKHTITVRGSINYKRKWA